MGIILIDRPNGETSIVHSAMLTITYEYKLQQTPKQIVAIEQMLDVCRSVWNFALRQRKDWCASRKSPINACSIQSEYINFVSWQRGILLFLPKIKANKNDNY